MKTIRAFFAAIIAVVVLLGPAQAQKNADQLVIGITQFPSTFHPNIDSMLAKTYILSLTRRPFTSYDKDWKLVCMLCVTLPTIENGLAVPEKTARGKQGIAVTYTIRADATWGDGKPVSTKDVMFTWKVGRHPKSGVGDMEFYRSLYKIDVKDAKTFTLHFDKLTFEYNAINGFELIPAHIDEINFTDPVAYKNRTVFDTNTTNEGLYFGPYLIADVESGAHVVLEPNPTWWGKKPAFKRIIVRVIPNTAALEANLLSGNIDMIAGELGLSIDQALAFEKRQRGKFNITYKPGLVYEHLDLNLDNPILKDIRVRRALILGIDRGAISKKLFADRQPVAHTSVNPLDWVYAGDIQKYPYDPIKAARLLNEAGWSVKKRGIRHNNKGEPLRLDLMTTAGNRSRELVEQVLQSQWKRLGIDIRIRNEPARVFFGQTVTERKFTGLIMYAWISAPESVPRTTLHSAHIPHQDNNFAGQNYTGFRNAEMDELLESIEVELNRPKRKQMWRRLQEIYATELPVIPLYFRANPYILPKWLRGLEPTGHQNPSTLWVEDWRVEGR
ncbi:MAG TPA: peptide ABC transporter substrate-binding protein [Rhodospirillales bacterium]|jgi:peptide/nickel transport system substrate-binding protein|nr:MAG: peptide ABC transporter [Rhodospirillaceae bacterium]PPR72911.1 MAG: Oligopeptide-binding protein AppA [Alphaproteobacteria bacterium MarineAlpha3_Bin2]HIC29425.1 peptide ABC transporter substrate-binding protein [Rhodospirillales bacterium]HIM25826.1 peptide ABC transporter substrate-binding protein [Rhodospirillales bacterium]